MWLLLLSLLFHVVSCSQVDCQVIKYLLRFEIEDLTAEVLPVLELVDAVLDPERVEDLPIERIRFIVGQVQRILSPLVDSIALLRYFVCLDPPSAIFERYTVDSLRPAERTARVTVARVAVGTGRPKLLDGSLDDCINRVRNRLADVINADQIGADVLPDLTAVLADKDPYREVSVLVEFFANLRANTLRPYVRAARGGEAAAALDRERFAPLVNAVTLSTVITKRAAWMEGLRKVGLEQFAAGTDPMMAVLDEVATKLRGGARKLIRLTELQAGDGVRRFLELGPAALSLIVNCGRCPELIRWLRDMRFYGTGSANFRSHVQFVMQNMQVLGVDCVVLLNDAT